VVAGRSSDELSAYPQAYEQSWLYTELQQTRNFKNWFKKGPLIGKLMTGIEQWALPKMGGQPALDAAPRQARPRVPAPCGRDAADQLPQAGRHADVRPIEQRVCQQHQPRRTATCAPDLKDASVPVKINLASLRGQKRVIARPGCTSL
jgi:electron-transferring-flavoprotein dehydrogenase